MRTNARAQQGFTLLEVVVSITILAMVVTCLYMAMSTAAKLWTRQESGVTMFQRKALLARLLTADFADIRRYTTNWERGQDFFFAGGPRALFYVTSNGLGAYNRREDSLYFSCLFFTPNKKDPNLQDLRLYKTALPENALQEDLHEFAVSTDEDVQGLVGLAEGGKLFSRSHLLLPGAREPEFSYDANDQDLNPEQDETVEVKERSPLSSESWRNQNFPKRIRLECELGDEMLRLTAKAGR